MEVRTRFMIGEPVLVKTDKGWTECTVEQIRVSEGMSQSRFRHKVEYKLRTNREPSISWDFIPTVFFSPQTPNSEHYTKTTTRYIEKEIIKKYPKKLIDEWFHEDIVYKDIEEAVRKEDNRKYLKGKL